MRNELNVKVLGSMISPMSCDQAIQRIVLAASKGEGGYVCLSNVHTVTLGRLDLDMRSATNLAIVALADGKPLTWMARYRGVARPHQVRGADLMRGTCEAAAAIGIPVYFYGGAPGVAQQLAHLLQAKYEGLKVAGWDSPPFRALTPREDALAIERIRASGAKIVWVALGAPEQEKWMLHHRTALRTIVMVGVGAAFDFETGKVREAPRWVQSIGLEWLYRLVHEPSRLWRRYLHANAAFVFYCLLEGLGIRETGSDS